MVAYADQRSGEPTPRQPGVQTASFWNPKLMGPFWDDIIKLAERMEGQGASVDEIFNQTKALTNPAEDTGLWRGSDNQWNVESTDEGMRIKPEAWSKPGSNTMLSGEAVEHPLMFGRDPELAKIPTDVHIPSYQGEFREGGRSSIFGPKNPAGALMVSPDYAGMHNPRDELSLQMLFGHELAGHSNLERQGFSQGDTSLNHNLSPAWQQFAMNPARQFARELRSKMMSYPAGPDAYARDHPDEMRMLAEADRVAPPTQKGKATPLGIPYFDRYKFGVEGEDRSRATAERMGLTIGERRAETTPPVKAIGGIDPEFRIARWGDAEFYDPAKAQSKLGQKAFNKILGKDPDAKPPRPGGSTQGRFKKGSALPVVAAGGAGGAAAMAPEQSHATEKTDRFPANYVSQPSGTITGTEDTLRDHLTNMIHAGMKMLPGPDSRSDYQFADKLTTLAEINPFVGATTATDDMVRAAERGDYLATLGNGVAVGLNAIGAAPFTKMLKGAMRTRSFPWGELDPFRGTN